MHMMKECKREKPKQQCNQLITLQYRVFHLRDKRKAKRSCVTVVEASARGGQHKRIKTHVLSHELALRTLGASRLHAGSKGLIGSKEHKG